MNTPASDKAQSPGEEFVNSASHGVATLAALVTMLYLIASAWHLGTASLIGIIVFCLTMVALYASSTLYHALPPGSAKAVMLRLDHGAIYLFIAGSYTPFALSAVSGAGGWTLFALVWLVAAFGIALKGLGRLSHPWLSTGMYLVMGWLVVVAALPLAEKLPPDGIEWIVTGGIAYTTGVIFFVFDSRIRYAHAVWHGFVAAGTGCHCLAVMSLLP